MLLVRPEAKPRRPFMSTVNWTWMSGSLQTRRDLAPAFATVSMLVMLAWQH